MDAPRVVGVVAPKPRAESRSRDSTETILSRIVLIALTAAIVLGWTRRESLPSADHGLGYALGIVGSAMMLILMVYPLRKSMSGARWLGSVGFWFRFHMLLGVVGPAAILYHARFTYAATNSGVALIAMLIVVASGLIGRFIYVHVYRGYSQRRIEARELLDELSDSRLLLDADGDAGHHVVQRLERLEHVATIKRRNLIADAGAVFYIGARSRLLHRQLRRLAHNELSVESAERHWPQAELDLHRQELVRHLSRYLRALREVSGMVFYDRLFRAWHYLHFPLFLFLLAAAALHVIAVHMY